MKTLGLFSTLAVVGLCLPSACSSGGIPRSPPNNIQIRVDTLDQNGATVSISPFM